jgi:hypothetical protein
MAGLSRKHPKIVKVKEYEGASRKSHSPLLKWVRWEAGNPSPPSLNGWGAGRRGAKSRIKLL